MRSLDFFAHSLHAAFHGVKSSPIHNRLNQRDWTTVLTLASEQRVCGLLSQHWLTQFRDDLDGFPKIQEHLRQMVILDRARNHSSAQFARRMAGFFGEIGIKAAPVKGAALLLRYPELFKYRGFSDFDILVPATEYPRLIHALQKRNIARVVWNKRQAVAEPITNQLLHSFKCTFCIEPQYCLDAHRQISYRVGSASVQLDSNKIFLRASCNEDFPSLMELDVRDQFLIILMHAAQAIQAYQVYDLAQLLKIMNQTALDIVSSEQPLWLNLTSIRDLVEALDDFVMNCTSSVETPLKLRSLLEAPLKPAGPQIFKNIKGQS